jgi:hypothetical protein
LGIALGGFTEGLIGLLVLERVQEGYAGFDEGLGCGGASGWEIDLA